MTGISFEQFISEEVKKSSLTSVSELIRMIAEKKKLSTGRVTEILRDIHSAHVHMPDHSKVQYLEDLILRKKLEPEMAEDILKRTKFSKEELLALARESGDEFKKLGLPLQNYSISFVESGNPSASPLNLIIFLPFNMGLSAPTSIAHEQMHIYQFQNSRLGELLKPASTEEYNKLVINSKRLMEGWAEHASMIYARLRDSKAGIDYYEKSRLEHHHSTRMLNQYRGTEHDKEYYEGFEMFKKINEKKGFEGVKEVALTLTSDDELRSYVEKI